MSDIENDMSDPGNFDEDNMGDDIEDGDQDNESVSSRSNDSDEDNDSENSDSDASGNNSESEQEYADDAAVQVVNINDKIDGAGKPKVTPPFLTKYEKARIIGTRALQIAQNSPIYVETDDKDYDPIAIAEKEFVQKKIPFIIRRYLPNKEYEDWQLGDLEVLD